MNLFKNTNFRYDNSSNSIKFSFKAKTKDIEDSYYEIVEKKSNSLEVKSWWGNSGNDFEYIVSLSTTAGNFGFGYGNNKEYASKVYKAFEHLFYLLEWNVKCVNKTVSENKF